MANVLIFIIGLAVGMIVGFVILSLRHPERSQEGEVEGSHQLGTGADEISRQARNDSKGNNITKANKTRIAKKNKNIEDVLKKMNKSGKITNNDVQKILGVSDATATRYLETLEKRGVIKQKGKTGKHVYYINE